MSDFKLATDLSGGLHFLNGKRVTIASEKTFPVYEPRTGKVLVECPISSPSDVDRAVQAAAAAQPAWAEMTPLERGKILRKTAELIRENAEGLARWEVIGNGKPIYEAVVDIGASADTFEYYGGVASAALEGSYIPLSGGDQTRFAYTRREPFGVVGCISAWNYPFLLASWKIAPALAAGNAIVFKPSPFAPLTAAFIGELLTAAGLPPGLIAIVQGEAETGQAICHHELVRKVSFTGSVATGQAIQRACAAHGVKPVTLELGGKSPLIIFDDAKIDNAIVGTMMANFANQGQVCTNATRVFVQRGILDAFTEQLLKAMDKLVIGDPLQESTRVGASINEPHLKRVLGFVDSAKQEGAKVLRGGQRAHPAGLENGFYFEPCVLTNLNDNMKVVREETFGTILLLLPFDKEEEAVERANNTPFGLAAGLFSGDVARAHRIAARLQAGTVFINTYNDCDANVSFGGFKASGHGRENSAETLHQYTQVKAVYVNVAEKLDSPF